METAIANSNFYVILFILTSFHSIVINFSLLLMYICYNEMAKVLLYYIYLCFIMIIFEPIGNNISK